MTPDYAQAYSYVTTIAGSDAVPLDWRYIHDTDKAVAAIIRRGTLAEVWHEACQWNAAGYGIFCIVNETDGQGRKLENMRNIRAHYADLDNLSAQINRDRAAAWQPGASFYVQSSAQKFHAYWLTQPYIDNDRFQTVQRKLRQFFDGDPKVIDATRVMRVPGWFNMKQPTAPHLVTCHALPAYGPRYDVAALETALAGVNVIEGGSSTRHALGDEELAAPSLDWAKYGLSLFDPNTLSRGDWIAITAAYKQSAWTHGTPEQVRAIWDEWCARYTANDTGENDKQWRDLTDTQLGWKSLVSRNPNLKAMVHLGGEQHTVPAPSEPGEQPAPVPPMPPPPTVDCDGPILTDAEQRQWFDGCIFVVNLGTILTPNSRFLSPGAFNALYGGKAFVWTVDGKTTDEPWKAATRSQLWTVPKVDHIRFLPNRPFGEIIEDDLGRKGVNTYRPARVTAIPGDVSPFLNHLRALLPDENDLRIVIEYLAHNVKYPGHKIPWAPVIQSAEGAGKGVLKLVMTNSMGASYSYFPNARELADSGAKFNAWMRNKLFILADEIKVDDRRDMIEVLKPMISEEKIEMQGKGENQGIEDNFANWLFFTNWRNAVPVTKNSRRFSVMYSPLQTADDLIARGMDEYYFKCLYGWLKGEGNYPHGASIVTKYLLDYPIERGAIPMRAPVTSSTTEAIRVSRGAIDRLVIEAIEDGLPGFRGGWISVIAVAGRMKAAGIRAVPAAVIETILTEMGYVARGRAPRPYGVEDPHNRTHLFHTSNAADVATYAAAQGYAV